ncbi:hypothetical protein [Achromobacter sp. ACRQX]|uniref:hypothetical protein n=1 Tax=Achromobacter sp. ACRQX TaxID=2918181 RepID=UPI001EF1AE7E|nr:hypothetical protein [Achromobacter sp. ACRQX]MCG7326852.1 hypothetical protein [Achromobacter sp. ACRQX]
MPTHGQANAKSFDLEPGGRRLIIVQPDEVVAASRKASSSQFGNMLSDWNVLDLGIVAVSLVIPGRNQLVKAASAVAVAAIKHVYDAWKSAREGGLNIQQVSFTEAKHLEMQPSHPILGTVYAAHPCVDSRFYPVANFHRKVFEDKVAEANRLLMSLGATSITIEHIQGWDRTFNASLTAHGAGADVAAHASRTSAASSNLMYKATYENDDAPALPENLNWYVHERMWQEVVEGRLKRGMRTFSLFITYDEDHNINAGLKVKLEKAGLDLGGTFRDHVATTWKMTGTFNDQKPA